MDNSQYAKLLPEREEIFENSVKIFFGEVRTAW
jgi:hypothetical protein